MRIDIDTPIWVVTDPGPDSTLPDVFYETDVAGLGLQFRGGLEARQNPTIFTTKEEAHEEAMNRLLVWKVASMIRRQRGASLDEVVRIELHDEGGNVVWKGEIG